MDDVVSGLEININLNCANERALTDVVHGFESLLSKFVIPRSVYVDDIHCLTSCVSAIIVLFLVFFKAIWNLFFNP